MKDFIDVENVEADRSKQDEQGARNVFCSHVIKYCPIGVLIFQGRK